MALNLLPVPPLDGSRVLIGALPDKLAWKYSRLEPYGLIILLLLMVSGYLGADIVSAAIAANIGYQLPSAVAEPYCSKAT